MTCEWRVFPADLLPVALQKGEVQAFTWAIRWAGCCATATA